MNVIDFKAKHALKRARELKAFLLELDSICDKLYDRLEFSGVWESLMKLEEVRVQHYVEFHEYDQILNQKEKKPNDK